MPDEYPSRVLPDGRLLMVTLLTYGRGRLQLYPPADHTFAVDEW